MKRDHLRYSFIPKIICRCADKNINNFKTVEKKRQTNPVLLKDNLINALSTLASSRAALCTQINNKTMLILLGVL